MMNKKRRPFSKDSLRIPEKANLVLNVILIAMLLIVLRIWHLGIIQHEKKWEEARKPQRKVIIEPSRRATIRDRFNVPLAINKVQYNASVIYSQLMHIPRLCTKVDEKGKRVKCYRRKEYITQLALLLGNELNIDSERLEDLIYSKASYYYQLPFTIKEDITESEYYRLKLLEKDWPGIHVQSVPRRYYPLGRVAGDLIGYMGAINREEYESILQEIKELEKYTNAQTAGEMAELPVGINSEEEAEQRLAELRERAYTINDYIGKTGIEGYFEESLRGFQGKKSYYSDARGNFLRELPNSKEPLPGQRLLLSISAELQEFAENLLIMNEKVRHARMTTIEQVKKTVMALKQPWIKGGAIVAMDPNNGEILALASYPRYDPNDFIFSGNPDIQQQKRSNVRRWLENEQFLAEIWDQKRPLQREYYDKPQERCCEEELLLTWEEYLKIILPQNHPVMGVLNQAKTLEKAIAMQKEIENNRPENILPGLSTAYDRTLTFDLLRLAVNREMFSEELLKKTGAQTLSFYRDASAAMTTIKDVVYKMSKDLFHEIDFKKWRKENEKEFLKKKRMEEKALKKKAKSYLDYFDAEENSQFQQFWEKEKWKLITLFLTGRGKSKDNPYAAHFLTWQQELAKGAHPTVEWRRAYEILKKSIRGLNLRLTHEYLKTLRSFSDLTRPLSGRYRYVRKEKGGIQLEKHLAAAFYPKNGFGFGRSQAYRQAATLGSIFKLVTAYEGIVQHCSKLGKMPLESSALNPLEMVDQVYYHKKELHVGYTKDGNPLPRFYKGGRMPRSMNPTLGKMDILRAIETSSNPYFALLAGDVLANPHDLADAARLFSFGSRTGIDLPGEIAGNVPSDLDTNRTGLYSTAIGQHTLVVTPLQTCVMLSAIANQGKILKPKILKMAVDQSAVRSVLPSPVLVKNTIFMPNAVRHLLLEGMRRVVIKTHAGSLSSLSHLYHDYPEAISDYIELKNQLIGKTSTAEAVENIDLDLEKGTNIYTHVWFGGIAFRDNQKETFIFKDSFGNPEIVVAVYLRFGAYGKEGAPLAAQMVKKWREIKEKVKLSNKLEKR